MNHIKKHAPIFWFHEDEKYFPTDVNALIKNAKLYKGNQEIPFNNTEEELEGKSKNHSLEIPEINMSSFKTVNGIGTSVLSKYMYNKFKSANQEFGYNVYSCQNPELIKLRMSDFTEVNYIEPNTKWFGNYNVLQYFPFYIFNDYWNKHVGDWDSTVEIIINEDKGYAYLLTSMHGLSWSMYFPLNENEMDFNEWINSWNDKKIKIKSTYNLKGHPFIFVANGAHGCYPTPGYTRWGYEFKIISNDSLVFVIDERQLGKYCLIPSQSNVTKNDIGTLINNLGSSIPDSNIKTYELNDIKSKPWINYKGIWGNNSDIKGWDGPTLPTFKRPIIKSRLRDMILDAQTPDYDVIPFEKNYHGI